MTFPQTQPVLAVTGGQDYWRLFTNLLSPGDLYESNVSGNAFVLGPQSDVAQVLITYFASQQSNRVEQALLSPDKPLVGRVDATNEAEHYPTGDLPGRILISTADTFDPNMPLGLVMGDATEYNPDDDLAIVNMPFIDLYQYFAPQGGPVPPRVDKTYYYQQYQDTPDAGTGAYFICIPYFGRRYAYLSAHNQDTGSVRTLKVFGVNFTATTQPTVVYMTKELFSSAFNDTDQIDKVVASGQDGSFDYLIIHISGGAVGAEPMPVKMIVSDDVVTGCCEAAAVPEV
jgi:hypothetical protein